jgi:hypothetical protein
LDISFPLKPARINASPSQRIRQYVELKATPLKASDATIGLPSPLKVLAMMPMHTPKMARWVYVSLRLNVVVIVPDLAYADVKEEKPIVEAAWLPAGLLCIKGRPYSGEVRKVVATT